MKRRTFLSGSVVGSVGVLALGANEAPAAAGMGRLMVTPAMVMAPRKDGVEIIWAVGRLARGWVEWREKGGTVHTCAADDFGFVPQGDSVMRVRIDGLQPGKFHEVRVVVESGDGEKAREETPWKSFRTLDPSAAATRFVVWNDTHENAETICRLHEATLRRISCCGTVTPATIGTRNRR
jgi:hypothetical protein